MSKRCSQHCSEGAAGNCVRNTVRGPQPEPCCDRRKLVSSPISEFVGVSPDDIYNDEEPMQILVGRPQDGHRGNKKAYPTCSARNQSASYKRWGNIDLYATERNSVLCAMKHSKEGTTYCGCGKCLIPSQEHPHKFERRIDILADPLYAVKRGRAGERHGPEEWQYHHWKAVDAARNSRKREYEFIARMWREDPSYRDTQQIHGWTFESCMFLDYLKKIQITLQSYSRRTKSIHKSTCIGMEESDKPG